MTLSAEQKRLLVEPDHEQLSIAAQCSLLDLPRSSYYYEPATETKENLELMDRLDRIYTQYPYYGSRRMARELSSPEKPINRKRTQRLMQVMGLEAIYPKPNLSQPDRNHKVYPYLLRGVEIERVDQVWSTDITYIGLPGGFMYLAAVIDWHSRYVLGWRLSNTLEGWFCNELLEEVLSQGRPEIFNTDQGVQFTANAFTGLLEQAEVRVSMDGVGRCLDNVFVERLWRSLKYENIYIKGYETVSELRAGLESYFRHFNESRRHQSLGYRTPAEVYGRSIG